MYQDLRKTVKDQMCKFRILYTYRDHFKMLKSIEDCFLQLNQQKSDFGWYKDDNFSKILIVSIAKNIHRLDSIYTLCRKGLAKDAIPMLRIIFEELVDLKYMLLNEPSISDYFKNDVFNRLKLARRIKEGDPGHDRIKEHVQSLEKEWDGIKKDFISSYKGGKEKVHKRWTKMSVEQVSQKVGLYQEYQYTFGFLSHYIHSTPISAEDYVLGEDSGSIILKIGMDDQFIPEVLVKTSDFFILLLKITNEKYKAGWLEEQLNTLENRLKSISS